MEAYLNSFKSKSAPYFGATVGRYAGRINNSTFSLNGKSIDLNNNNNGHSLHGGNIGFSQRIWKVKKITEGINPSITLTYFSPNIFEERVSIPDLLPTVNGVVANYTVNPTLPAGLGIDPASGRISGTPTLANPATNYTITASNSTGSTGATTNITVLIARPQISYTTPNVYYETVAITPLVPNKFGTVVNSFTISPGLPAGLNFDNSTGIISGASNIQIPRTTFTITGTNSTNTGSTTVDITVTIPPPTNLTYINPPSYFTGTAISTLTPTVTGFVAGYSIDKQLPNGLNFNTSTGAITGTPT
jgi:hypothetical protein